MSNREVMFYRVASERFRRAVSRATRIAFITVHTEATYAQMRCFLSENEKTGYAIDEDGDLQSVFNIGRKGAGEHAVRDAVRRGARTLMCFDGFLPAYYARFGFAERGRDAWNEALAPGNWDEREFGKPDVVFMELRNAPEKCAGEMRRKNMHKNHTGDLTCRKSR